MHPPQRGDQLVRASCAYRGTVGRGLWGPCRYEHGGLDSFGLHAPTWPAVSGHGPSGDGHPPLEGSGGLVFSVWWGGGEAPIRSADEPPAALMHDPMMRRHNKARLSRSVGPPSSSGRNEEIYTKPTGR